MERRKQMMRTVIIDIDDENKEHCGNDCTYLLRGINECNLFNYHIKSAETKKRYGQRLYFRRSRVRCDECLKEFGE